MNVWRGGRMILYGTVGGITMYLIVVIPTAILPTPWFTRMTPVRPLDIVLSIVTALLAAAIGATFALPSVCRPQEGKLTAGGLLAVLAVGCPICNKVVVLLLGVSGAFTYFEPVQPVLGLVSVVLMSVALALRLRATPVFSRGIRQQPAVAP